MRNNIHTTSRLGDMGLLVGQDLASALDNIGMGWALLWNRPKQW